MIELFDLLRHTDEQESEIHIVKKFENKIKNIENNLITHGIKESLKKIDYIIIIALIAQKIKRITQEQFEKIQTYATQVKQEIELRTYNYYKGTLESIKDMHSLNLHITFIKEDYRNKLLLEEQKEQLLKLYNEKITNLQNI